MAGRGQAPAARLAELLTSGACWETGQK